MLLVGLLIYIVVSNVKTKWTLSHLVNESCLPEVGNLYNMKDCINTIKMADAFF